MEARSILQGLFFSSLILLASYSDIKRREIPDIICILIIVTGLVEFNALNLLGIFIGLPFLIAAILKEDSIGGGDIKLTAAVGTLLGFFRGIYGLIIGLSLLVTFYVFKMAITKIRKEQVEKDKPMPLAPFLGLGFIIMYFIN